MSEAIFQGLGQADGLGCARGGNTPRMAKPGPPSEDLMNGCERRPAPCYTKKQIFCVTDKHLLKPPFACY